MNHTGKEGESKQAVGNRRQQQITDKLYCTFVYSRTDKNFEFIQNWLLNAFSISKLEFPRFVFDTLKSLSFCGCHKNIFLQKTLNPFYVITAADTVFAPGLVISYKQMLHKVQVFYKKCRWQIDNMCGSHLWNHKKILCWNVKIFNWGAIKIISHWYLYFSCLLNASLICNWTLTCW